MNLFFSECIFYLPKLTGFFSEIGNNLMRAGQKKTRFFLLMRGPKSNARAHLKQRKKHSGLIYQLLPPNTSHRAPSHTTRNCFGDILIPISSTL